MGASGLSYNVYGIPGVVICMYMYPLNTLCRQRDSDSGKHHKSRPSIVTWELRPGQEKQWREEETKISRQWVWMMYYYVMYMYVNVQTFSGCVESIFALTVLYWVWNTLNLVIKFLILRMWRYLDRRGIDVGVVELIVYAQTLQGKRWENFHFAAMNVIIGCMLVHVQTVAYLVGIDGQYSYLCRHWLEEWGEPAHPLPSPTSLSPSPSPLLSRLGKKVVLYPLSIHRYIVDKHKKKGSVCLQMEWATIPEPFAYQTTVKDITAFAPEFRETVTTLTELFPPKSHCFILSTPHYGSLAEVSVKLLTETYPTFRWWLTNPSILTGCVCKCWWGYSKCT